MSLERFAAACEAVAATTRKTEKVRIMADYLRSLDEDDRPRAALYLTARAFPRREERTVALGGSLAWQAVSRLARIDSERLAEVYRRHGDLGGAAAEVLAHLPGSQLSLADVEAAFRTLAESRGPALKVERLEELLARAGPLGAKYLIKILTGDLRIGLKESLVEEALAQAFAIPRHDVQRANMLLGDIAATARLAAAGKLSEAQLRLMHPVGFMLASPADSAEDLMEAFPGGAWIEDKYDGIRAQAHKGGSEVKLFSRTLDEIVEFQELIPLIRALPSDFILDGEIIGWRDGRPLPFTQLQKRLGRKQPDLWLPLEVPVAFVAFDVIYHQGSVLFDEPWSRRRERLESLFGSTLEPRLQLSRAVWGSGADAAQRALEAALARGNEGIMAKAADAPYTPGRRGRYWLKLKRPMATLDVVVTAVEYGHGKRHGVLSDYTFAVRDGDRLVNIGKAYSGLTDAEIAQLTEYFKQHTIDDQGFRRTVEPSVVLEVAFNNIQRSNRHESGYALRFPRILRLRPDKPVAAIDTLERVAELFKKQARPEDR
jgi:DNA ligase-1